MPKPHRHLGFLMSRAVRLQHSRIHAMTAGFGLYPGQAPIMFELWREDGLVQKELSKRVHLAPATLTVTLDRMERAGFLERRRDPMDQRACRVFLTDVGRSLKDRVDGALNRVEEESFRGFTGEERDLMRDFLRRYMENLGGEPDKAGCIKE